MARKGFTLIELVIVIVLLGIIGGVGAAFFSPLLNLAFHAPAQTSTAQIANRLAETMIEGDQSAKGLRLAKSISAAADTSLSYVDVDGKNVVLSWNSAAGKISRTAPSGTAVLPVEFPNNSVLVNGQTAGVIFKYFDSSGAPLSSPVAAPANIVRVQLNLIFWTGSGQVKDFQSKYILNTGVRIRQF